MKLYGLKLNYVQKIKDLLQKYFGDIEDLKAYLYGSRATGNHKSYSDIDIVVKSKKKNQT